MVTANNFGPDFKLARHRAARTRSAVESGPPDTASTSVGASARSPNSALVSEIETGRSSSAVDTLLFPLDTLPHTGGGARKFATDLGERRASHFTLAESGKRLAQAQHRVGRLGTRGVFGRDQKERFGRRVITLALEARFAEPELRV